MVGKDLNYLMKNACISNTIPNMTFIVGVALTCVKEITGEKHQQRIDADAIMYEKDETWRHAKENQLTILNSHILFLRIKNLKMSLHRSQLFQQKIRDVFDLIICQLVYLHRTVTNILFLPCYHLAFEVYMFLFLT
jgi:hypothetical protein